MNLSFDSLKELVRGSVSTLPVGHVLDEGDVLSTLGIDSIATLGILVEAADRFALNLEQLSEDAPPPSSLGDLFRLLTALSAGKQSS
jgi:hypothetical protein